jgi:hypothetical protein
MFDAVMHVLNLGPVVQASQQLGYPVDLAAALGIVELVCLGLYLAPGTAALGAILLTGYLGGAVAAHARVGSGPIRRGGQAAVPAQCRGSRQCFQLN